MILKILICLGIIFVLWLGHVRAAECYKFPDTMTKMLCLIEDTNDILKNFDKRVAILESNYGYVKGFGSAMFVLIVAGVGKIIWDWVGMIKRNGRNRSYPMNEVYPDNSKKESK
mgnify:CR=1 FL=1